MGPVHCLICVCVCVKTVYIIYHINVWLGQKKQDMSLIVIHSDNKPKFTGPSTISNITLEVYTFF